MKALVVRENGTNKLICFGPDNGSYDPGPTPNSYRRVEPDYVAVLAEYATANPPKPSKAEAVLADPSIPQWFKDYIR